MNQLALDPDWSAGSGILGKRVEQGAASRARDARRRLDEHAPSLDRASGRHLLVIATNGAGRTSA